MRWSIIRLIWLRELRDQLRDRRTLFMIAVLPLLLYPVLGFAVLEFAFGFAQRPSDIGIVSSDGSKSFPERQPESSAGRSVTPRLAWLAATPISPDAWVAAAALSHVGQRRLDYPQFLQNGDLTNFDGAQPLVEARRIVQARLRIVWLPDADSSALTERKVDVIVHAPTDFFMQLDEAEAAGLPLRPAIKVLSRPGDDYSKLASQRLRPLLDHWKKELRQVRLLRKGVNPELVEPFEIQEPQLAQQRPETIVDLVVRIFPFMLVMWSLAGALYPAVDVCAG